jgi:hypothetical protein
LNAGSFGLVQLYPKWMVGDLSEPLIYSELWDVTPRLNEAGALEMVKSERGPVFSKNGECRRDWDPLFEVPVYIINFAGLGISNQQVCDGAWLSKLPQWMTSAKKRYLAAVDKQYKEHKAELADMSEAATDFLWREANKTGATAPLVPWEMARKEVYNFMENKKAHRQLETLYKV